MNFMVLYDRYVECIKIFFNFMILNTLYIIKEIINIEKI